MANPLIKICGIRHVAIAKQSIKLGAHFIGLIFHPSSKRWIDLTTAKKIARTVRIAGAIPVAVFVEHTIDEIRAICTATDIHTVQLHGENAKLHHHLLPDHYQRIMVFSVSQQGEIITSPLSSLSFCDPSRDYLLFDNAVSGSGKNFNWQRFRTSKLAFDHQYRWFLAGGLTAHNIVCAIKMLKPTAIDVSSGVENNLGSKDTTLIKQFITTVQNIKDTA